MASHSKNIYLKASKLKNGFFFQNYRIDENRVCDLHIESPSLIDKSYDKALIYMIK